MSFNPLTALDTAKRLSQIFNFKVVWGDKRDVGKMGIWEDDDGTQTKQIFAPYPLFAADFGVFLHELGHLLLEPKARAENWPNWKAEARASNFALKAYEELKMPDVAKVAARLGELLEPNLTGPIRRGAVTYDEVRAAVYPELLAGRLAEGNGYQPSEDEVRGWLAGPPV